jgi:3-hydroxybutyryl-CoA dehydrogenase
LFQQYGERFRPARLLKTKVRAGHLGVKAGRGFHEYA